MPTLTVEIELTDIQLGILEDVLLDPLAWVETAIREKIGNHRAKIVDQAIKQIIKDKEVETIPADYDAILDLYFSSDEYKKRKEREAGIMVAAKK